MFNIHCNKVIVTISQLRIWDISWPITHSISSLFIVVKSPVETATRELFFVAQVAKAFGSVST
ncbi:MAG: hypothetical protein LBD88_02980 [Candidatus Peribacteria bacterium]|nr:hypothetical protein [Candidatus Peribacteria bacterium]